VQDKEKQNESFAALFEASKGSVRRRHFAVGDELEVVVVQVGKDAVFVELDGKQEGFIEAEELSDAEGKITVKVGSRLSARVVEKGDGGVRLSPVLVAAPNDAGETVAAQAGPVIVGARIKGPVIGIETFGVFVQVGQTPRDRSRVQRGLVPIGELGLARGADPHKHFTVGKDVEAKVIAIDERGRIRLSFAALGADEEHKAFEAFEQKSKKAEKEKPQFGTLGDLIAKKKLPAKR
jgi:small subunit ribosomal protein S1